MHRYSQKAAPLVATIERGDSILVVAPGGVHFGLLPYAGPMDVRSIWRTPDGVAVLSARTVPIPLSNRGIAAIAPIGVVAIIHELRCSLFDQSGASAGGFALEESWGGCVCASFSASGATLWLSFAGTSDNRIVGIDAATHASLGVLQVPSSATTSHLHRIHPHDDVVLMQWSDADNDVVLARRDGDAITLVGHKGYAEGIVAVGMDKTGAWYRTERGALTRVASGGFQMDRQELLDIDAEPEMIFEGVGSMLDDGPLTLMTHDIEPGEPQVYWHRLYDSALDPVLEMEIELDADGERCRRQDGLADDLVILSYENEYLVLDWSRWLRVPQPTKTSVPVPRDSVWVSDPTHHPESGEEIAILRTWMVIHANGEVRCTLRPEDDELTGADVEKGAEWRGTLIEHDNGAVEITLRSAWGMRVFQGRNDAEGLMLAQVTPPPLDVYRFELAGTLRG